jgi:hypothetical protein
VSSNSSYHCVCNKSNATGVNIGTGTAYILEFNPDFSCGSICSGQTTQWPKEKGQKDKQQSTKHTHKTKDQVTPTPLKTRGALMCTRRVSISCSNSGIRPESGKVSFIALYFGSKRQYSLVTVRSSFTYMFGLSLRL